MRVIKKYGMRLLIVLSAVIFLVGCDQTTKKAATTHLKDKAHKEIAGIINLQYIENDGGMLSLGSKLPADVKFVVFILIVTIFLFILFFHIIRNHKELILKQLSLILILSGGIGNLIDPSKHIFTAGIGFDLKRAHWSERDIRLDFFGQYHWLVSQHITKSPDSESGNAAQSKVGSPGYDIGGKVYGGGISLTMIF